MIFSTISRQLALVFTLVLFIAAVVGAMGVVGARLITGTIQQTAEETIPLATQASSLADTATRVEAATISYLLQPEFNKPAEGHIHDLLNELSTQLADWSDPTLVTAFETLSTQIDESIRAHAAEASLYFVFDEIEYSVTYFLNAISVENSRYFKALDEAARFGIFENINLDPTQTNTARWAAGFTAPTEEIDTLIKEYLQREEAVISYVAQKIEPKPEKAESQIFRLKTRRVPKMESALDKLIDTVHLHYETVHAENRTQLANLRTIMENFITVARAEQAGAMTQMEATVESAAVRGQTMVIAIATVGIVGLLLSSLAAITASRRIGPPLGRLSGVIVKLADRDFDVDVPDTNRVDEIGDIAQSAETFRENGLRHIALERAMEEERNTRQEAQAHIVASLASGLNALAEGNLDYQITKPFADGYDQLRLDMNTAITTFRDNQTKQQALERSSAEERARRDAETRQRQEEQSSVVTSLANGLTTLASGDLSHQIKTPFADGYEQLRQDFNAAVSTLSKAIGAISLSSSTIGDNAQELTSAANHLATRTETSAASLEETAGTINNIANSVQSASTSATEADGIVQNTLERTELSRKIVEDTVVTMSAIDDSSQKVANVTGVIDDIAFQTNLLALNAGVEAARAGEAGRGFAVVASEVRMLAQRSSDAASEIKELIANSEAQVRKGVEMVDKVGDELNEILSAIADISNHVSGIATTSRVQASGIGDVNKTIAHLDQMTQQNAAMFEETSAATLSLTKEVDTLSREVSRFTIDLTAQSLETIDHSFQTEPEEHLRAS